MHIGGIQVERQGANVIPRIFAMEAISRNTANKYCVACLLGSTPG
jgi:hypothetical protein